MIDNPPEINRGKQRADQNNRTSHHIPISIEATPGTICSQSQPSRDAVMESAAMVKAAMVNGIFFPKP
jgi:hypothetical protein